MEIASNRKYTDLNIGYEESYTPVDTKDVDNATYGYLSNSFHAAIIVNTVFGSTLRNYFNYDFISEDDARFIEKLKNKTTVEDALISLSKSCEVYACSTGFVSGTFRNSGLDDILRDVYLPELKEMYGLDYVDFSMKSAYSAFCPTGGRRTARSRSRARTAGKLFTGRAGLSCANSGKCRGLSSRQGLSGYHFP